MDLIVVSWRPFQHFLSLFHIPRFAFSHLQIAAERIVAEDSASKLGDVSCHCNVLLGKEVEGVSKCCGYWVLTFLSACHQQEVLFWVNTANNSRRQTGRGWCSLNHDTARFLTLPSSSIAIFAPMLFYNCLCQAAALSCQLFVSNPPQMTYNWQRGSWLSHQ